MSFNIPNDPEEDPDWLKDVPSIGDEGDEPEERAGGPADEELPDWLKDTGDLNRPSPAAPKEAVPDWLSTPSGIEPRESGAEEEPVPDWLASIRAAESERVERAEPTPESEDWLDAIRQREAEEAAPEAEENTGTDFLSRIRARSPQEPAPESGSGPDWLSGLSEPGAPADADLTPDWLKQDKPSAEGAREGSADWLANISEDDVSAAESGVQADFPDLPREPRSTSLPTWLAGTLESSETPTTPLPRARVGGTAEPSAPSGEAEDFSLDAVQLPDWLSEIAPSKEESVDVPAESAPADLGLAPAELPSWLQAMRPVDAAPRAAPRAPFGDPESVGPLSGLADVLPAEPEIVQFGRTPVHSTQLNVSTGELNYAALLKELVAEEGDTPPIIRRAVALPQRLLKAGIAALLYLVLLAPVLTRTQSAPLPSQFPPVETLETLQIVNALPAQSQVLAAFDYQPAYSGEMEAAAASLIDHILLRGARLVLLSTNPSGPVLAEQFLQSTQSQHTEITGRQYVNMGYLSGGASALLNFAAAPQRAMPLIGLNGASGWGLAPLNSIQTIRDFELVLVLTDDPETARAWVEQVGPVLASGGDAASATPLVMAISAQAEPLVYPYFESSPRQISGLVTGIGGGAFYESQVGDNVARVYWNAFGAGLTAMVLIVLVGGFYNLGRSLLNAAQTRTPKEPRA